jgi:cytochrome P450
LAYLRSNAPVALVEAPGYRPFYAITKHADITAIERANELFTNAPRPVLMPAEQENLQAAHGVSTLIHMDDPRHRKVRAIGADWFRPKAMRALRARVDELAKIFVNRMRDRGASATSFKRSPSTIRSS